MDIDDGCPSCGKRSLTKADNRGNVQSHGGIGQRVAKNKNEQVKDSKKSMGSKQKQSAHRRCGLLLQIENISCKIKETSNEKLQTRQGL